jgi:hypothetical protein
MKDLTPFLRLVKMQDERPDPILVVLIGPEQSQVVRFNLNWIQHWLRSGGIPQKMLQAYESRKAQ